MPAGPVANGGIKLEGFKELIRDLKGGEERLDLEIRKRIRALTKDIVDDAKAQAAGLQPKVPAHVINSIRASVSATSSAIKLGNEASAPDALGHEYGAAHNAPRQTVRGTVRGWNQFPEWRGNAEDAGYFLWPTIRRARATLYDQVLDIVQEIIDGSPTHEAVV